MATNPPSTTRASEVLTVRFRCVAAVLCPSDCSRYLRGPDQATSSLPVCSQVLRRMKQNISRLSSRWEGGGRSRTSARRFSPFPRTRSGTCLPPDAKRRESTPRRKRASVYGPSAEMCGDGGMLSSEFIFSRGSSQGRPSLEYAHLPEARQITERRPPTVSAECFLEARYICTYVGAPHVHQLRHG